MLLIIAVVLGIGATALISFSVTRTIENQTQELKEQYEAKQKKIILTAKWYLKQTYQDANQLPACRFDVVTVEGELENPAIELYKNAFRVV